MLKKIATKEIDRFCQMVINNTPFPVELDHQELIKVNRSGNEISTINFDTNYASSIGAKIVNNLDELYRKSTTFHTHSLIISAASFFSHC